MTVAIDLTGHRALVTGAGQNVGRGIAHMLAAAGAEVLVNDLVVERTQTVVGEIEATGGHAGQYRSTSRTTTRCTRRSAPPVRSTSW